MSNYFENFPSNLYSFGDGENPVYFQRLSRYVDLIDQVKDDIGGYIEYEILEGDRPDTLAYRLYGTSEYEWTFFSMNERLRETGWPMKLQDVYDYAQTKAYKNYTCNINLEVDSDALILYGDSASGQQMLLSGLAPLYDIGQAVILGEQQGVVTAKNLAVGEITVRIDSAIANPITPLNQTYLSYDDGVSNVLSLTSSKYEYEGTHHFVDSAGDEIDYFYSNAVGKIPVTNLEYLIAQNQESKRIRVIKKQFIDKIVGEHKRLTSR